MNLNADYVAFLSSKTIQQSHFFTTILPYSSTLRTFPSEPPAENKLLQSPVCKIKVQSTVFTGCWGSQLLNIYRVLELWNLSWGAREMRDEEACVRATHTHTHTHTLQTVQLILFNFSQEQKTNFSSFPLQQLLDEFSVRNSAADSSHWDLPGMPHPLCVRACVFLYVFLCEDQNEYECIFRKQGQLFRKRRIFFLLNIITYNLVGNITFYYNKWTENSYVSGECFKTGNKL